jgi:hypothetical protein
MDGINPVATDLSVGRPGRLDLSVGAADLTLKWRLVNFWWMLRKTCLAVVYLVTLTAAIDCAARLLFSAAFALQPLWDWPAFALIEAELRIGSPYAFFSAPLSWFFWYGGIFCVAIDPVRYYILGAWFVVLAARWIEWLLSAQRPVLLFAWAGANFAACLGLWFGNSSSHLSWPWLILYTSTLVEARRWWRKRHAAAECASAPAAALIIP